MNITPEWFKNFILNLNGDEIFWAPILMIGLGLLFLWVVPSFKGIKYTIIGWLLFAFMLLGASSIWFHIWDWRADQYTQELSEELDGTTLMGTEITSEDVYADPYGIVNVSLDLEYEFGYSELFVIADIEDIIDYLVIQYKLSHENEREDSYLDQMRNFQELHISINANDGNSNDVLSYHYDTLIEYANSTSLIDPNAGYFWSDSEQAAEAEVSEAIDETGYRVVRTGYSPWYIHDERASEGGISLGQWGILMEAPDALDSINQLSCGVLNLFEECEPEESYVYHSVSLVLGLMILILITAIITELIIRKSLSNKAKEVENKPYKPRHASLESSKS